MTISYQLYSSRDAGDWGKTLSLLADTGYDAVEGFGGIYADPPAFRNMLDQRGLTMPSGHFFPIASFEDGFATTLSTAQTLGMERLYCPAPEDAYRKGADADAWTSLAKRLETAAKKVQDAGYRFGWHNHHWEFGPLADGTIPMNIILDHAPSIEWEIDVAWVVRGGADPLKWIADFSDRIATAHVKDIAPEGKNVDEDGWADVGDGVMDWAGLAAALRGAGVDLFVMEHDKPSDAGRFARRAIEAFRSF